LWWHDINWCCCGELFCVYVAFSTWELILELLTSALGELLLFRPTKKNAAADIVTDVLLVIAQLYLTTCQFQTLIWSW
jgi:hypothetical protein